MDYAAIGRQFKAKYPQYSGYPDEDVGRIIVGKGLASLPSPVSTVPTVVQAPIVVSPPIDYSYQRRQLIRKRVNFLSDATVKSALTFLGIGFLLIISHFYWRSETVATTIDYYILFLLGLVVIAFAFGALIFRWHQIEVQESEVDDELKRVARRL